MKRRLILCAMLLACVLLASACQSNNNTPDYTPIANNQNVFGDVISQDGNAAQQGNTQNTQQQPEFDFDLGMYDPTQEENGDDAISTLDDQYQASANQVPVNHAYAGATPVVIDPIDKPTPTPVPPLTFTYQAYYASKLNLAFEAPVGWQVNDTVADTYILTNPARGMDYQAAIVLRAVKVGSQYNKGDLESEVKAMLTSIGASGFSKFSPSNTAERTQMDKTGVYANYTGTLSTGVEVAGRVHVTCIDKVLYSIHITYPKSYTETYKDTVYAQLRKTLIIR